MYSSTKSFSNLYASIVHMQEHQSLEELQANQIINHAMKNGPDHKLNRLLEDQILNGVKGFNIENMGMKHEIFNDKVLMNLKRERATLQEINSIIIDTALQFSRNPDQIQLNEEKLKSSLNTIKNLHCERSLKIDLIRNMKEGVLTFVPEEHRNDIERVIISKQREIERTATQSNKVVLESKIANSFNPR
ncbi:hypothetical protein ACT4XR_20130 (plasmid) [Acinetobacter baumannii]|uniref:hypothetical protein n=1 Tax=Acinetobacter baumannii TaxID=470 RepID=UPI0038928F83